MGVAAAAALPAAAMYTDACKEEGMSLPSMFQLHGLLHREDSPAELQALHLLHLLSLFVVIFRCGGCCCGCYSSCGIDTDLIYYYYDIPTPAAEHS